MRQKVFLVALILALPLFGGKEPARPMPNFSGTLKRLDAKTIVMELDDNRVIEFRRTAKTRFVSGKKALNPAQLKAGDAITVEAREDIDASLIAINVHLEHSASGDAPPSAAEEPTPGPPGAPPSIDTVIERIRAAAASLADAPSEAGQQVVERFTRDAPNRDWQPLDRTAGAASPAEYRNALRDVLAPATAARFRLRGESALDYDVDRDSSAWQLRAPSASIEPAYRGSVTIDPTGRVLRLEMQAVDLPPAFPLEKAEIVCDYELMRLGDGRDYLLPVHSESVNCERGTGRCTQTRTDFKYASSLRKRAG